MTQSKNETIAIIELKGDLSFVVKDNKGDVVKDPIEIDTIFKELGQLVTLELKSPSFTILRTRSSEIIRVIIDGTTYCFRWTGTTWVQSSCA